MKPDRYAAIVFDLDGTLIDGALDITDALNRALSRYAVEPITHLEVARFLGGGPTVLIDKCLASRSLQLSAQDKHNVLSEYTDFYRASPSSKTRILGSADAALPRLVKMGIQLGICTNKRTGIATQILQDLKLDTFISCVVGSDSVDQTKPDPRHLLECLARLGQSTNDTLYVGDTDIDFQAARAAGVDYAHVMWGLRLTERPPEIRSFTDLITFSPGEVE